MKVTLTVVRQSGELFFRAPSGLLFDRLTAYEFLSGGKLTISRRGKVFDQTTSIEEYGTHAATTCFHDLKHLYPNGFRGIASPYLDASNLKEGDHVDIQMPRWVPANLDFSAVLQRLKLEHDALEAVLPKPGKGITLGKLKKKFQARLAKQSHSQKKLPSILRFRPELVPSGTANLPKPVRQILRRYLNARGLKKPIAVSFWRGPLKEGKRTFYIVDTNSPTMRTYHVDTGGKVTDKGCHYPGRWDGMG